MFQYYDSNKREYVNFDESINTLLESSKDLIVYAKNGDSHYVFDMSSMMHYDMSKGLGRKMRKV